MKRFLVSLLTLFALAIPLTAQAGHWDTKEIFWSVQGGRSGTDVVTAHDTSHNVIAGGQTDTTGWFSLSIGSGHPFLLKQAGTTGAADTTVVGWLIFAPDSTASVTAPTISSITVELDGAIRGLRGTNVGAVAYPAITQVDSLVVTQVSTLAAAVRVPIYAYGFRHGVVDAAPATYNKTYGTLAFPDLRARITAATGVLSSARAFVRYWKED